MHLSRVTQKATEHAAAAGNAADLLSALLGGDSATAATFPTTLQEAIAGSEPPADDDAAADDGSVGDDGTDTIVSLEAALAAAGLDLGRAANAAPPADPAAADGTVASGDAAGTPGAAGPKTIAGAPSVLVAAAAAAATGKANAATDGKQEAATADQTIAAAAKDALPAATADTGRPVPAALVATDATGAASPARPGTMLDAPGAAPSVTNDGAPTAHVEAKGNHATPDQQHGDGIAVAVHEPFSSGGSGRQGLDLGTPEREQAGTAEASKRAATTVVPAATTVAPTVGGRAAEAVHLPSAGAPADRGEGAAPPPPSTGPTHTTATVERGAHASTASAAASIEARWGERVADALRLSAVRGGGEIRLQLEPEGLGHIDVRVHLQADGVRAVIVAEHESTRALLQSQQHVLEDALARGDVRLSGFSVDVGSGGGAASFAASSEQEGGGRPGDAASSVPTAGVPEPGVETNDAHAGGRLSVRV